MLNNTISNDYYCDNTLTMMIPTKYEQEQDDDVTVLNDDYCNNTLTALTPTQYEQEQDDDATILASNKSIDVGTAITELNTEDKWPSEGEYTTSEGEEPTSEGEIPHLYYSCWPCLDVWLHTLAYRPPSAPSGGRQ